MGQSHLHHWRHQRKYAVGSSAANFNNVSDAFAFFPDEAPDCGVTAMEIGIDGNAGYNIKCYAQPTFGRVAPPGGRL